MDVNAILMNDFRRLRAAALTVFAIVFMPVPAFAQNFSDKADEIFQSPADRATYADLVSMAEASDMIVRVKIRRQTMVEPERAPGLVPGDARLYIEARTQALIAGERAVGESLVYLVDVPLTAKGKAPKLKKREMVLFARRSPNGSTRNATAIHLVGRHGQLDHSLALEQRLRPILTNLAAGNVPPRVMGVSDALSVFGNLVGESETQIFLATQDRSPVSISVLRRPGQPAAWGVSWGEIIDLSSRPPPAQSLQWYRLACALPALLPPSANLARDAAARQLAMRDYAFVIDALGPCEREITEPSRNNKSPSGA